MYVQMYLFFLYVSLLTSLLPEAVNRRCSVKKNFLRISHNSQQNTTLLKKKLQQRGFPVNCTEFLQ